jgi:hypothetical protein
MRGDDPTGPDVPPPDGDACRVSEPGGEGAPSPLGPGMNQPPPDLKGEAENLHRAWVRFWWAWYRALTDGRKR